MGTDTPTRDVRHVSGSIKDHRTASELPHSCPVCGRLFQPSTQSVALDGSGPVLMQLGDLCLKGGRGWLRAYYHDAEVCLLSD